MQSRKSPPVSGKMPGARVPSRVGRLSSLVAFPLAAVAMLLFAGCGGGDDDTTGATVTASSQATSAAGTATEPADETPEATDDPGDDGAGGSTDIDACSLLTADEAALTLGADVSDGESQDQPPFVGCLWTSTTSFDFVQVSVYQADREGLDVLYALSTTAEPVGGVGDKAQWTGVNKALEVLSGNIDLIIEVRATDMSEEDAKFQATGLAERALGRLP